MRLLHRERPFTRDIAAVASGLAVGVVGSRLLPPLLAGAAGSMRAGLGENPFDRLMQDHRSVLSLLDRLVGAAEESAARRMAGFLAVKRALAKHALAEEDVVYPLLQAKANAAAAAKQLYSEHAEMKVHLYELEMALSSGTAWAERARALQALIARHIRDEEDVQFPKLQGLLDAEGRRRLAGQVRREEALIL
jgi:iron-sulfur cluster repair protein YtfE (RIC family)